MAALCGAVPSGAVRAQAPQAAGGRGPEFSPLPLPSLPPIHIRTPGAVRILPAPDSSGKPGGGPRRSGGTGQGSWDDAAEAARVEAGVAAGRFRGMLLLARRGLAAPSGDRVRWLLLNAWLERNTGGLSAAEKLLAEAVERCRSGPRPDPRLPAAQAQLADLWRQKGDFAASAALWSALPDPPPEELRAQVLEGRGLVLAELGEWHHAEQLLTEAVEVRKKAKPEELSGLLQARYNLAALQVRLGFYRKAAPVLREILSAPGHSLRDPLLLRPLTALAHVAAARDWSGSGSGFFSPDSRHEGGAQAVEESGSRTLLRRLLDEALAGLEETQGKESPAAAEVLAALAGLDFSEGRLTDALERWQFVLVIRRQHLGAGHPLALTTLQNLGEVLLAMGETGQAGGRFAQAARGFESRLGARHPFTTAALERCAWCAFFLGRREEAAELARRLTAAQAGQRDCLSGLAGPGDLAGFYRGGTPWELPCVLGDASLALTSALHFKGTADEEAARMRSLRTRARQDPEVARLMRRRDAAASALRQALLQEETKSGPLRARPASVPGAAMIVPVLPAELRAAQEEADAASRDLVRAAARPRRRSLVLPAGRTLTSEKTLCAALGKNGALIDFLKYRHHAPGAVSAGGAPFHYAAVMLSGSGRRAFAELGTCQETDLLVEEFHRLVRDPAAPSEAVAETARRLHVRLLQPLEPFLRQTETERLALCPDGQLHFVPFAALPDRAGQFAGSRYRVVTVGSARDLLEPAPVYGGPQGGTALLVGNPFFNDSRVLTAAAGAAAPSGEHSRIAGAPEPEDGTDPAGEEALAPALGYLPGAEAEVREAARLLQGAGWHPVLLTDQEAGEGPVTAALGAVAAPRLVHFATHGLVPGTGAAAAPFPRPLARGGLALAGAQTTLTQWQQGQSLPAGQDGILLSDEVAQLDLGNTALAVLSACHSGYGEALEVEGLTGLSRAFRIAGVPSRLVALWPLPDDGTPQLILDFYRTWLGSGAGSPGAGLPPEEAFSRAQQAALKRLQALPETGTGGALRAAGAYVFFSCGPLPPASAPAGQTGADRILFPPSGLSAASALEPRQPSSPAGSAR